VVCESYNFGDLVYILYEKTIIAMGLWMGIAAMGKNNESFAKIFQLDKGEIIYFEKGDDTYSFRLASSIKTNDNIESRK
tara:strand:- start:538 stop:774 length:237 start_codon:yes stop_codon:yes gene_type:complete